MDDDVFVCVNHFRFGLLGPRLWTVDYFEEWLSEHGYPPMYALEEGDDFEYMTEDQFNWRFSCWCDQ